MLAYLLYNYTWFLIQYAYINNTIFTECPITILYAKQYLYLLIKPRVFDTDMFLVV